MLKYSDIDASRRALAEPTRRAIVERLSRGPASFSDLAKPFDITLAAIVQHLQVPHRKGWPRADLPH
jgi:DNA-binding transcriptional ArsR family regulator